MACHPHNTGLEDASDHADRVYAHSNTDIYGYKRLAGDASLDGPGWSLFFEYIANILYALFIRRFSKKALSVLVILAAVVLIQYTVTCESGDVTGGWSLNALQLRIGFTRLMYPFFAGLLLSRTVKPTRIKNSFLWCSLLLVFFFSIPRIGGQEHFWMNGLYESLTIILVFPLIVYMGASGEVTGKLVSRVCKFLGDISYPIYITHYPLMYIYTGWVSDHRGVSLGRALPYALATLAGAVIIAYACLKLYDEPVRRWLQKHWLSKQLAEKK